MKFHRSIVALGRAIYAIRPEEGAKFDPAYAIDVIANTGVGLCAMTLSDMMKASRPGQDVYFTKTFMGRLAEREMQAGVAHVLAAYLAAELHFPDYTDLFGLAADWLHANRGVDVRNHFAGMHLFPSACGGAIGKLREGKFNPDLAMLANGERVGSSALGLMMAVNTVCGEEKLADTDFVVIVDDFQDLCLAFIQISLWLCVNPHAVRGVSFIASAGADGGHTTWGGIGELPRSACVAKFEQEAA